MLKIPKKTEYVIETLQKNGFEAYIVGGCVRDLLLSKSPCDFDVTTSAKPEAVMSLFEKTVPTGIKHGTVTVIVDGEALEVTTFRTESGYQDNRHPETVNFVASLKEDLARRDFTVNAIAYNHESGLCDYFGGITDLKNKILRAVGCPEIRFGEDALRILRLFRFSSTLCFSAEEKTLSAALSLSKSLENISMERITAELKKAVLGDNLECFSSLISVDALSFLGMTKIPDFKILKAVNKNPDLAFFLFFYLSGADTYSLPDILKLSNNEKQYFAKMTFLCDGKIPSEKAELKQKLRYSSQKAVEDYLLFLSASGEKTDQLSEFLKIVLENSEPYLISHLALDGNCLKDLGFTGTKIGEAMNLLLEEVIVNPQKNTPEKLCEFLKNL